MNSSSKNTKFSKFSRGVLIVGVLTIGATAAFYTYKYFKKFIKLDSSSHEQTDKYESEVDKAIRILAEINKVSDEKFKKYHKKNEELRIAALNDDKTYENTCNTMLNYKETIFNQTSEVILDREGYNSLDEIHNLLKYIPQFELEKRAYMFYKPFSDNDILPTKDEAKDAFLYYAENFKQEMGKIQEILSDFTKHNPQQLSNIIFYKILVLRIKLDDKLFVKYNYTESQIRYLLFKYNLFEDKEVKRLHNEISKFEENISPFEN